MLASIEGPVHAVSYSYEPNRDLMSSIDNKAGNLTGSSISKYSYQHDALNRRTDRTQSGSAIATTNTDTFSYDSRSQVIASENDIATAAVWNPTYTYDPIGNRLTSTGFIDSSYVTNELNQYTELSVSSPPREPVHDEDGNLIDNGDGWTFAWNAENRLMQATNGTTTIDFTYDYQGRLVKKDDGTSVIIYVYDGWNRIFEIQFADAMVVEGALIPEVDGFYQRDGNFLGFPFYSSLAGTEHIKVKISITPTQWGIYTGADSSWEGALEYESYTEPVPIGPGLPGPVLPATPDLVNTWLVKTFPIFNAPDLTVRRATWAELQSAGVVTTKSYVWGLDLSGSLQGAGGVGGLLSETKNDAQGTTNFYPLYDANGNVMQKLDDTGSIAMNVAYDPFGNIIEGTLVGEYGFSTKPLIDDLNWYYYGFRYYDPETGRWPSRDPIEEDGGLNLYLYSFNDSLNWIDYLGMNPRRNAPAHHLNVPPRPDGFPGFPRTFIAGSGEHGGPGWASGQWILETDPNMPRPGDPDYLPPNSRRDRCHAEHDLCINGCGKNGPCEEDKVKFKKCVRSCDHKLGNCMLRILNPIYLPEAILFHTIIPYLIH